MVNLKEFIKDCNLTQKQFSEIAGVSLRSVQRWCEKNHIPPYIQPILKALLFKNFLYPAAEEENNE